MIKKDTDGFIKKAMDTLRETGGPAEDRKEAMLQRILVRGNAEKTAAGFRNFVVVYPWRFALGVSVVQSVVCTLIFGSGYTNLIMQLLGR